MIERRSAMRRRLGWSSTAARLTYGGAPTPAWLRWLRWWQGLLLQAMDWHGKLGAMAQWWRCGLAMVARFWGLKGPSGWSLYRGKVWRDTEGLHGRFISSLILFTTITGRIQKGIVISLLWSKTLLWIGVLWPYGLGVGPRAGDGGARWETGSNTAPADGERWQTEGPGMVCTEAQTGDLHPQGWAGIGSFGLAGVGLALEKKKWRKRNVGR
jgi:hypothetical protein